jgi:hypothetical protein
MGTDGFGLRDLPLSKHELAEGYLVGTVVVLNAVLFARLLADVPESPWWVLFWLGPSLALIAAVVWLRRARLPTDQIWVIAQYGAFGIGLGTTFLLGMNLEAGALAVSGSETFRFGAIVSTLAMVGILSATTHQFYRSNRDLDLRNRVLRRVLRHDLRNDMTVVLCLLDDIESSVEGAEKRKVRQTRSKIETVVDLTDKVRRVDVSTRETNGTPTRLDLAGLVQRRVSILESTYPDMEIEVNLPESVGAWVDGDFGMVVDSVVESAVSGSEESPRIEIGISVESDSVILSFEDRDKAIPEADYTAVGAGSETALEHARGVELWLVRWLVEASDGDLFLDGNDHRIEITLDRATGGSGIRSDLQSYLP